MKAARDSCLIRFRIEELKMLLDVVPKTNTPAQDDLREKLAQALDAAIRRKVAAQIESNLTGG